MAGDAEVAGRILLRRAEREFVVEVTRTGVVVDGVAADIPQGAIAVGDRDTRWVFLDGEV